MSSPRRAARASSRLAFIRAAQVIGLTLAEVRRVLGVCDAGEAPCRVVTDLIDHRHADVKARIAELRRLECELAALRARAAKLRPRDCDPQAYATSSRRSAVQADRLRSENAEP